MIEKIEEYCRKKYPTRFGDKKLFIEEREAHYMIYVKDGSPVYLNKKNFQ